MDTASSEERRKEKPKNFSERLLMLARTDKNTLPIASITSLLLLLLLKFSWHGKGLTKRQKHSPY